MEECSFDVCFSECLLIKRGYALIQLIVISIKDKVLTQSQISDAVSISSGSDDSPGDTVVSQSKYNS